MAVDGTVIPAPGGWWLDWQLLLQPSDALIEATDAGPLVTAGLVSERGALARFASETVETLADHGFDILPAGVRARGWDYVVRSTSLDQLHLIEKGDLQDQGQRLAHWVDASFRAIADALASKPD